MNKYVYQAPIAFGSTKRLEIKNQNGVTAGFIQRYYQSKLHSITDFIWGENKLIVRIKAFNPHGEVVIDAYRKNHNLGKPDFYLQYLSGKNTFHARQQNNILINPEFLIKGEGIEILTITSMMDWVRFIEGGREVARWRSKIKNRQAYIEIERHASIQDPLFYAVFGQMLYFIGQ